MNETISPTSSEHTHPFATDADWADFEPWEKWYLGVRAYLHGWVFEELATAGPVSILADFFDAYGLALEADAGNPNLHSFMAVEPKRPQGYPVDLNVPLLASRVDACAAAKPLDYPAAEMPAVARLLREKAAEFEALAARIDEGAFRFPG